MDNLPKGWRKQGNAYRKFPKGAVLSRASLWKDPGSTWRLFVYDGGPIGHYDTAEAAMMAYELLHGE